VNGGLARSEGRRVKPSAVTSSEVNVVSRPHRLKTGEDRREGPGWREIVIQRLSHRQKRCGSRGTGAVKATGSYEGSLSIEGIPDHHEASAFTRRRSRWSWRSPHFPTRAKPPKRRTHGQVAAGAKAAEAEGERGSRQGCQRLDRIEHRGKKTPTLVSPGREAVELELRVRRRSAEAVTDVVKRPVPRQYRTEP